MSVVLSRKHFLMCLVATAKSSPTDIFFFFFILKQFWRMLAFSRWSISLRVTGLGISGFFLLILCILPTEDTCMPSVFWNRSSTTSSIRDEGVLSVRSGMPNTIRFSFLLLSSMSTNFFARVLIVFSYSCLHYCCCWFFNLLELCLDCIQSFLHTLLTIKKLQQQFLSVWSGINLNITTQYQQWEWNVLCIQVHDSYNWWYLRLSCQHTTALD